MGTLDRRNGDPKAYVWKIDQNEAIRWNKDFFEEKNIHSQHLVHSVCAIYIE